MTNFKKYFSTRVVVPFIIILGALILFLLFKPNLLKQFQTKGEIEFTKGSQVVQHNETPGRLRGRITIPAEEISEFIEKNELKKSIRRSPHDDIIDERCTHDQLSKVMIRLNEQKGNVDIDIMEISKYPDLECNRPQ